MASLSGARAIIVGTGSPYADLCRTALDAQGAAVTPYDRAMRPGDVSLEPVDILVTCPPTLGPDVDDVDVAAAVNACVAPAAAWASRVAGPMQMQGGGVIVHLLGLAGLGGWPGWQAAGAAYAALHNLTESSAVALARHRIRVNALVPGVDERLAREIATARRRPLDEVRERIPVRRFMPEAALAQALVYLVHPSSSYVSGETLVVDGGWDIWGRLSVVAS